MEQKEEKQNMLKIISLTLNWPIYPYSYRKSLRILRLLTPKHKIWNAAGANLKLYH